MTSKDQFMTYRCPEVALADARLANGNDIDRLLKKRSLLQPLDVRLESRGKALEIEGAKGFFHRQAALSQQTFCPPLMTDRFFAFGQFVQIGFMREAFLGRFQSQIRETPRHACKFEALQQHPEFVVAIDRARHSPS